MPEWVFRGAGFVLLLVYRVIRKVWEHRLSSRLKEEPTIVRAPVRERVLLTVMGLLTVPLFVWFSGPWLDFAGVPLPEWVRWVGAGICAVGVWYFERTHRALAQNWSPLLEVREGATLVTSGPYRLVRHPMYSSAMVVYGGFALLCANWLVATTLFAGVTVVFVGRFRDEERMMLDAFGDDYREYMARTGRLAPKLGVLFGRR
jgi:protein-S-isoprenylcysteine O-methyltransferase Ste14